MVDNFIPKIMNGYPLRQKINNGEFRCRTTEEWQEEIHFETDADLLLHGATQKLPNSLQKREELIRNLRRQRRPQIEATDQCQIKCPNCGSLDVILRAERQVFLYECRSCTKDFFL